MFDSKCCFYCAVEILKELQIEESGGSDFYEVDILLLGFFLGQKCT